MEILIDLQRMRREIVGTQIYLGLMVELNERLSMTYPQPLSSQGTGKILIDHDFLPSGPLMPAA